MQCAAFEKHELAQAEGMRRAAATRILSSSVADGQRCHALASYRFPGGGKALNNRHHPFALMKSILSSIVLCAAALTASVAIAETPGEVKIGGVLRDAQMQGLSGTPRKLSAFRGKPLIINVWASWCGPCRAEMGSLDRLSRRYGGKQFNVIGISTDDYRDRALDFLQQARTGFSHYIDSNLLMENMLGADRIPLTLLVDAQGRVLAKFYGAKEWDSPQAVQMIGQAFGTKM